MGLSDETAFRNGTLEGAYLIMAARMLGLSAMPMSGFDSFMVEDTLLNATGWRVNFLVGLGYPAENEPAPDHAEPRAPAWTSEKPVCVCKDSRFQRGRGRNRPDQSGGTRRGRACRRGKTDGRSRCLRTFRACYPRTPDAEQLDYVPDRVVAVIGPGSFTGLRSSLSLAAGLAAGWNCPTIGVTLGAAIRATLARPDAVCVSIARRGRVFVDPPHGPVTASQTADLDPTGWACVTGDAVSEKTDWPCPVLPARLLMLWVSCRLRRASRPVRLCRSMSIP